VVGRNRHKESLEQLRIPQVVEAWLLAETVNQAAYQAEELRQQGRPVEVSVESMKIGTGLRNRLSDLLKVDAGPMLVDWFDAAEEHMAAAPTPLTEPLRQETDRVVEYFHKYLAANRRWHEARPAGKAEDPNKPADPNWDIPTTDAYCREIDAYVARVEAALAPPSGGTRP
jgi:hypothetical protein